MSPAGTRTSLVRYARAELPAVDVLDVARAQAVDKQAREPDLDALQAEVRALLHGALSDLDALHEVVRRT